MKMILDLDMDLCISCGACAVACMDQNDTDLTVESPFRTVFPVEKKKDGALSVLGMSIACMHCDDAPCIKACPSGCLKKDADTGFTVYDNTNCIGCHSCAMACPFGAPKFNAKGKMIKCDGCIERVRHGLQPACVRTCPFDALRLWTEEEHDALKQKRLLREMTKFAL